MALYRIVVLGQCWTRQHQFRFVQVLHDLLCIRNFNIKHYVGITTTHEVHLANKYNIGSFSS